MAHVRRPLGWTLGSYVGQRAYGCRKVPYKSQKAAEAHVRHLRSRGKAREELGEVETYRCRSCGQWHVGHAKRGDP